MLAEPAVLEAGSRPGVTAAAAAGGGGLKRRREQLAGLLQRQRQFQGTMPAARNAAAMQQAGSVGNMVGVAKRLLTAAFLK
jgi:hypothetical protein